MASNQCQLPATATRQQVDEFINIMQDEVINTMETNSEKSESSRRS
jgi:hypothetical protein